MAWGQVWFLQLVRLATFKTDTLFSGILAMISFVFWSLESPDPATRVLFTLAAFLAACSGLLWSAVKYPNYFTCCKKRLLRPALDYLFERRKRLVGRLHTVQGRQREKQDDDQVWLSRYLTGNSVASRDHRSARQRCILTYVRFLGWLLSFSDLSVMFSPSF